MPVQSYWPEHNSRGRNNRQQWNVKSVEGMNEQLCQIKDKYKYYIVEQIECFQTCLWSGGWWIVTVRLPVQIPALAGLWGIEQGTKNSHSWTNYKVQPSHIYSCYNLCVEMFPQENRSNRWQHCKWKSMSVQKFKKIGCGGGGRKLKFQ